MHDRDTGVLEMSVQVQRSKPTSRRRISDISSEHEEKSWVKIKDLLAVDVGGGTQDILLWQEGVEIENCVKLILPSWSRIIAAQVREATRTGQPIFLYGRLMGGGACNSAVRAHIRRGLRVMATPETALTLHDNLHRVREMGVEISEEPLDGARKIRMRDIDVELLTRCLEPYGITMPQNVAVAVQDHGYCPESSNRAFRFQNWEQFIRSSGKLNDAVYLKPPQHLTRMLAVQKDVPRALVMDTCMAAIRGALLDETVAMHRDEGILIVNVGNHHLTAALILEDRIWGVMEHHTEALDTEPIMRFLERFYTNVLSNREIFDDGGHGCMVHPDFPGFHRKPFVSVTGPKRGLLRGTGVHFAAPCGDMMLTGCFGLLDAALSMSGQSSPVEKSRFKE